MESNATPQAKQPPFTPLTEAELDTFRADSKAVKEAFQSGRGGSHLNCVVISGKWLIKEGISEQWARQRQMDPALITEEWCDYISIIQLEFFAGLLWTDEVAAKSQTAESKINPITNAQKSAELQESYKGLLK
jgi:hypothetical protein